MEPQRHRGHGGKKEWVFLDLGETLFDETDAMQQRFKDLKAVLSDLGRNCTIREIESAFEQASAESAPVLFKKASLDLGLSEEEAQSAHKTVPWRHDLEKLVPGTEALLQNLKVRYQLGVIANQSPGTEDRLRARNIRDHFSIVLGSGDIGVSKPDPKIFQLALAQADCPPEKAVMVGDRIDFDIRPAKLLGMRTIRLLRGIAKFQQPKDEWDVADFTVSTLEELSVVLLDG